VIAGYFAINFMIGLWYRRRATGSTEEFFVSGRNVSWWLAGPSMVATTFAADTPPAVTGLVASYGIAGNWLRWNLLIGHAGAHAGFFDRHVLPGNEFRRLEISDGGRCGHRQHFDFALVLVAHQCVE